KQQQARFLSLFLLIAIPIIAGTYFTSDLLGVSAMTYLLLILFVVVVYLGSRTSLYNVSLIVTISGFTVLPLLVWFFGTNWVASDLPRLMPWIFIALTTVTLLTKPKIVVIQGAVVILIMIVVAGGMFAVPFEKYDSHLATVGIIIIFVYLTSYMLDSYVEQLSTRTQELDRQHRELGVYMQFLRHDLSNDVQGLLYSIELADMLLNISADKAQETLAQTISLAERMAQLFNIFTMPLDIPETDLVRHIEEIAKISQESHVNLSIEVSTTDEVHKQIVTASRLLSLVWTNIFRNASQHGGPQTIVRVNISLDDEDFVITIKDSGPGIPVDKKDRLFKRGTSLDVDKKGQGLYLSRIVLEGHGGSIKLSDNSESDGAKFIIRIPVTRPF
ncbi:MAG: sensor histidine kinase, partial [Candidatus Thorarchaeota archaeon]